MDPVISDAIKQLLVDKLYEKRKIGARMIQNLCSGNVKQHVMKVLEALNEDFLQSKDANYRKGGLEGIAALVRTLRDKSAEFVQFFIPGVLLLVKDHDHRVRYYACDALYNIITVLRAKVLVYFNEIYDVMCFAFGDVDHDVRNGAVPLDKGLRVVLLNSKVEDFPNLKKFIPLMSALFPIKIPSIRILNVSWLLFLDSFKDVDIMQYLHLFLDHMLYMLADNNSEDLGETVQNAFEHFLGKIRDYVERSDSNWINLCVNVLISHIRNSMNLQSRYHSKQQLTECETCLMNNSNDRIMSISWLCLFVNIGRQKFMKNYPEVIDLYLFASSDSDPVVSTEVEKLGYSICYCIEELSDEDIDLEKVLGVLDVHLFFQVESIRIKSAEFIVLLLNRFPKKSDIMFSKCFQSILQLLSDRSNALLKVASQILSIFAKSNQERSQDVFEKLTELFFRDKKLLYEKGSTIIASLVDLTGIVNVYKGFGRFLEKINEQTVDGVLLIVQNLNKFLLSHKTSIALREHFSNSNDSSFKKVFSFFCADAISALSLCLWMEKYELCSELVSHL
jgi:vacuole morphology and inheritance protein 14